MAKTKISAYEALNRGKRLHDMMFDASESKDFTLNLVVTYKGIKLYAERYWFYFTDVELESRLNISFFGANNTKDNKDIRPLFDIIEKLNAPEVEFKFLEIYDESCEIEVEVPCTWYKEFDLETAYVGKTKANRA